MSRRDSRENWPWLEGSIRYLEEQVQKLLNNFEARWNIGGPILGIGAILSICRQDLSRATREGYQDLMDRLMAAMTRLRSFLEANRELYAARIVNELQWGAHALEHAGTPFKR